MRRNGAVLSIAAVLAAGLATSAPPAAAGPDEQGDHSGVRNILPPGQSGTIGLTDAAGAVLGDPAGGLDRGAPRLDADRDGGYDDQAAVALFDAWWEPGEGGVPVAHQVLRGTLGDLVTRLPQRLDDHPRQGLGSAWNGVAWYGYVVDDLRRLAGEQTAAWSRSYCGGGDADRCRTELRNSLRAAADALLVEHGVSSVDELTYDKHADDIRHVAAGVVGVRDIDWQNRPTFQQVIAYKTGR